MLRLVSLLLLSYASARFIPSDFFDIEETLQMGVENEMYEHIIDDSQIYDYTVEFDFNTTIYVDQKTELMQVDVSETGRKAKGDLLFGYNDQMLLPKEAIEPMFEGLYEHLIEHKDNEFKMVFDTKVVAEGSDVYFISAKTVLIEDDILAPDSESSSVTNTTEIEETVLKTLAEEIQARTGVPESEVTWEMVDTVSYNSDIGTDRTTTSDYIFSSSDSSVSTDTNASTTA